MVGYLLDTDICISLLQGKYGLKEKIRSVGVEHCAVSEITLLELRYGAEKGTQRQRHLAEVELIGEQFSVLLVSTCFPLFASEKVRLQREGALIPDFDLLIGTTAISNGLIMVTNNTKHLQRLQGIQLENWRDPADNRFAATNG